MASSFDLLNMDPDQFVAALDELDIRGPQRAALEQQYFAKNRPLPISRPEGRRIASILPMSMPEGMTGAEALMAGEAEFAVPEFIRGLYEGPAEAANVANATLQGIPVTQQQMQDAALTAAGAVTGVGPATRAVDAAQSAQLQRLLREVQSPEISPESAVNARFYYPSRLENSMMQSNPTATEQMYMQSADTARNLLRADFDPEFVASRTGQLPVPLRTMTGIDEGYRLVAALPPEDFTAYRPVSANNIRVENDPSLRANDYGSFSRDETPGAGPKDFVIALNPKSSPQQRASTLTHEMTHGDLMEGDIGWNELGMSPEQAFQQKMDSLQALDSLLSTLPKGAERAQVKALRDELAAQTSYELYSRNPGEMLARLSEGDATMARRMTATELLNPKIRRAGAGTRLLEALATTAFSETRPYMQAAKRRFPDYVDELTFDRHMSVPMDLGAARLGPDYVPENPSRVVPAYDINTIPTSPGSPFAQGGVVPGSALDVDPLDLPFR